MMTIEPQSNPSVSKVAFTPAPRMPIKAKNEALQMANMSFTIMPQAYTGGR
jgi:hypothetical protein